MRRVATVAVVVAGVGLLGTGVRGLAAIDGRLADAADRPVTEEVDVKRELRGPDGCQWRERRDDRPAPLSDARRL
jgi:hypothetical protein